MRGQTVLFISAVPDVSIQFSLLSRSYFFRELTEVYLYIKSIRRASGMTYPLDAFYCVYAFY